MKESKFALLLVILCLFLVVQSSDDNTEYDFQILLDQFDDLKNIPLIFKNDQFKQIMNSKVKCFIGSFIGFPNSGKTFIFNLVQKYGYNRDVNLPSGYHVSTKGISGLVNTNKDGSYHLWIDSEGMQKAVQIGKEKFEWQGEIEDPQSKYKYQQIVNEEFQKNDIFEKIQIQLLLRISNPVILVIDSLNEQEQKYIFQLYQSYADENNKNQKQTIIIFNNKFATNQEELQKNLEILERAFPLQSLKKDGITYYQDKRFPNIKFLILANHYSSLGQQINPFVYKNIADIAGQKFLFQNILSTFKEYFNNNLWRYVNFYFKEGQEIDYSNLYKIDNKQNKISLAYELTSEIKPKILSISPLGQNQEVIQYVILQNEQSDYLLIQVKIFLPGEIQFIKYDVFLEKQTQHQYLSVKYVQKKDAFYLELERQMQTQQFPPSEQLQFNVQNEFDVQHEFDILITQKVGTATLSDNQPTQSKDEQQNGIFSFEIQFFPDD
ncbi:hypothetical protein ABPG74_020706 [Tetrahymena malaccensis]